MSRPCDDCGIAPWMDCQCGLEHPRRTIPSKPSGLCPGCGEPAGSVDGWTLVWCTECMPLEGDDVGVPEALAA